MGIIRSIRRSLILKEGLLSREAWSSLLDEHPILKGLDDKELEHLRELTTLFLHEKVFEGADSLEMTDFMRAVISVQACLPVLHLGLDWYENWKTIVVVPDVFVESHQEFDKAGVAHEWDEDNSGESWDAGPVILSWKDVEASGWGDGYNVVIHEAAHRLDLLDGEPNGRPALHQGMSASAWREAFSRAYSDLRSRSRRSRRKSRIDTYAAESDSEFFAVVCEYFFEKPRILTSEYPAVYGLLREFFKQDPAERLFPRGASD